MHVQWLSGPHKFGPAKGQGPSARIHVGAFGQCTLHNLRPLVLMGWERSLVFIFRFWYILGLFRLHHISLVFPYCIIIPPFPSNLLLYDEKKSNKIMLSKKNSSVSGLLPHEPRIACVIYPHLSRRQYCSQAVYSYMQYACSIFKQGAHQHCNNVAEEFHDNDMICLCVNQYEIEQYDPQSVYSLRRPALQCSAVEREWMQGNEMHERNIQLSLKCI